MLITCFNHLNVKGPAEEIRRFVDATTGKPWAWSNYQPVFDSQGCPKTLPDHFCFNAFLPVPETVIRRQCVSSIPAALRAMTDQKLQARYPNVSSWCENHWGCKWDIWDQEITRERMGFKDGSEELDFGFESHRIPAFWLEEVFQVFPELTFHNVSSIRGQFAVTEVFGYRGEYFQSEVKVIPAEEIFGQEADSPEDAMDDWWKANFPDPDCPF